MGPHMSRPPLHSGTSSRESFVKLSYGHRAVQNLKKLHAEKYIRQHICEDEAIFRHALWQACFDQETVENESMLIKSVVTPDEGKWRLTDGSERSHDVHSHGLAICSSKGSRERLHGLKQNPAYVFDYDCKEEKEKNSIYGYDADAGVRIRPELLATRKYGAYFHQLLFLPSFLPSGEVIHVDQTGRQHPLFLIEVSTEYHSGNERREISSDIEKKLIFADVVNKIELTW